MEYLKDYLDTGQTEDGLSTSNQLRNTEVHILFLTLNTLELAMIYLWNGKLGRSLGNLLSTSWQISSITENLKQGL